MSLGLVLNIPGVGQGGGWSPAKLGSLGITILPKVAIAQAKLFKDTGKTQLATANGDAVRVQTCPFTGVDVTFTAGWTLNVSGSDVWIEPSSANATFNLAFNRRDFSAGFSLRPAASAAQRILLDSTSSGFAYQENSGVWLGYDGSAIPNSSIQLARSIDTVCGVESGATNIVFRQFTDTSSVTAIAAGSGTSMILAQYRAGGFNWAGRLYGMIVCTSTLTGDDLTARDAYLQSLWPASPARRGLVIYDGNSFVAENDNRLNNSLGPSWVVENYGVSGQTTTQMSADAATQIDPRFLDATFTYPFTQKYLIATELTNDLYLNNASSLTLLSNMSTYLSGRTGAQRKIITDILDRSQFDSTQNATKAAVNAALAAEFDVPTSDPFVFGRKVGGTYPADFLVKISAMGITTRDGIHPDSAGYNTINISEDAAVRM